MGWNPLLAVTLGLVVAWAIGPVVRRLPRTADAPDYPALATPRWRALVGLTCSAGAAMMLAWAPPTHWVAWAALVVAGIPAVCIDAQTTWLPLPLARAGWVIAAAGVAVAAAWARDPVAVALSSLVGTVAVGGFFHLVWRAGQIGYGDVRLMATVGAVTALGGWTPCVAAVFLGTVLGALTGIVHRLRGGRGEFPYGPGLLAGAFAALPLAAWAG